MTYAEVEERQRHARATTGSRCARRRAASTSTPASPATPAWRSARCACRASSTRDRRAQGDLHAVPPGGAERLPRRRSSPAPTCRATARSAAPAPRSAPRTASTSTRHDEIVELEVGNIILATGYDVYDATKIERYGYGAYPNVLTALEFERLTNASGPTGGKIVCKTQALQQAQEGRRVGLRRRRRAARRAASRSSTAWARATPTTTPTARASAACTRSSSRTWSGRSCPTRPATSSTSTCAPSGRATRSSPSASRPRAPSCVRGRTAKVFETDGQMVIRGEDIVSEKLVEFPVDMVLLAVGLVPAHGTDELAQMLGAARPTTAGSPSSTTTPTRPTPSAAASTSPASARRPRTSPTRWRRPRRSPPACSSPSPPAAASTAAPTCRSPRSRRAPRVSSGSREEAAWRSESTPS